MTKQKPRQNDRVKYIYYDGEVQFGKIILLSAVDGDDDTPCVTVKLENGEEEGFFEVSLDWDPKNKHWVRDEQEG